MMYAENQASPEPAAILALIGAGLFLTWLILKIDFDESGRPSWKIRFGASELAFSFLFVLLLTPMAVSSFETLEAAFKDYQTWYATVAGFGGLSIVTWWQLSKIESSDRERRVKDAFLSAAVASAKFSDQVEALDEIIENVLSAFAYSREKFDDDFVKWQDSYGDKSAEYLMGISMAREFDQSKQNQGDDFLSQLAFYDVDGASILARLSVLFDTDYQELALRLAPLGTKVVSEIMEIESCSFMLRTSPPSEDGYDISEKYRLMAMRCANTITHLESAIALIRKFEEQYNNHISDYIRDSKKRKPLRQK